MPNRILRESILDSERVNKLSVHAELFYRRLMSVVDDFGRFDARLSVLRSRCYPLRVTTVREADISRWLAECETAGLIALYSVDAKQYLLFFNLGQQRAKTSKYPAPPAELLARARTCAQSLAYGTDSDSDSEAHSHPARASPFEQFWEIWPKKKHYRPNAEAEWERLSLAPAECATLLAFLQTERESAQWMEKDGRFIPKPHDWLKGRPWRNPRQIDNSIHVAEQKMLKRRRERQEAAR